jgi:type I restriction enzyme, S subunit
MTNAPTSWQEVTLGDVCEFRYGKSLPDAKRTGGDVPVFGSNGIVGMHSKAITKGMTIIVGRKGSFGQVNLSPVGCWPIDTAYYVDVESTQADLRWLAYRLSKLGLTELNKAAAVPGLNRDDAYRQRLLLPPLPEQRRIAEILDRADALRAKRRAALTRLDALTESIFLDLFGDPVGNPKGWPDSTTLGEAAAIVSGVTKGRNLNGRVTREVPYLAVVNVQDKFLDLSVIKTIQATDDEMSRLHLERGDLLLTEGGDPDKLGRGTLWNNELPECIHQNHVFRVRLVTAKLTPLFLNWLVGSQRGKSYFLRSAKQTTGIASINTTQLRGFPLLMPPLELQRDFSCRMHAVEKLRASQLVSLAQMDALFRSVQHRAFQGGLQ